MKDKEGVKKKPPFWSGFFKYGLFPSLFDNEFSGKF